MDLDEWELLPHDGLPDYHENSGRKNLASDRRGSNPKTVLDMNYYMVPSSSPRKSRVVPNQVVPVTIQLEPVTTTVATGGKEEDKDGMSREVTKVPLDAIVVPQEIMPKVKGPDCLGSIDQEADQDSVSQVFFKKMKENEFVDMKLDSPKSSTTKGFMTPQIDAGSFSFDDKSEALEAKITSPRIKGFVKESAKDQEAMWEEENNNGGSNLWKWSLTGIGAICSFGVAAATICVIILGSQQKNIKQQDTQKLRFQIYTDDKQRIKEMVQHVAVRGVPATRAHISYGGYYNGL